MNFKRLFFSIFPKGRKRTSVVDALPLALFLALFAGACLFADWKGLVRFSRPSAFLLSIVLPWIWWMHHAGFSGLRGARAQAALCIRLVMAGLFIILLAEPRAVRKSDKLSIVYALDISDSMGEKVSDASLGYITKTASAKPEKDEAGLVVFGRDAAVELPPRTNFPFEAINSRVGKDGTDIEKGLSLAAAMLPEGNEGRIVLISDGNENQGNAAGLLDELKSRGIAVDVLPVQFDYQKEVWLERLDLPRVVKLGETYEASVILSSLRSGSGKLALRENGKVIFEKEVDFNAGKNRFTLPLYLRSPGYYEYVATIDVPRTEDSWPQNNIAINDLFLRGEGKVLVVADPHGDSRDWETLVVALKQSRRVVEVGMAYEFPRDTLSLAQYDCIVFANAPADAFDASQFQALHDAIYNLGVGFIMVGGANSFVPGGYHGSAVEEALPVTMDITEKKVLPKAALVIILHTCEFPEGNTWAKRIAKQAIRVLGAQDDVGLLDFEAADQWVFPLTPAAEYERLIVLINKAAPSDMPSFTGTMKMALNALKASDAAAKHVILISDGDPSPPTPGLINDFVSAKISISTVAINPHGGQDISIMQTMSHLTGGRYYFPQDPEELPSIFIKEAKTLKRSMIQNKLFTPTVEFPSPILKGISSVPQLRGYVLTTPKPRATTILKGPETEEIDPVLATWRFGLGTTAAFTSDLSPNWGAEWVSWSKYQAFVQQLVLEVSRVNKKSNLQMQTIAEGGNGVITVEDFAQEESFLTVEARVNGPDHRSATVPLRQVAPRRYQGQLPLWGKGRYQVLAVGSGPDGRNEQAAGGFVIPYSPEYLTFRSNPALLTQIARRTGGRMLTGNETDLFHPERRPRESSLPVFDYILALLAILLPLDVGIRRIQIDWELIRGWFRPRRKGESTETLGALLARKQEVSSDLRTRGGSPPIPPRTAPRATPAPPSPPAQRPAEPAAPSDEKLSTTERLLARKKKRKEEEK